MENWRRFLLKEETSVIRQGENIILFSDWARGHIEKGHKEPGLGSIFADFDISLVDEAIQSVSVSGAGGVYELEVSNVGYDLVLPMKEASALEGAEATKVKKQERGQDIEVDAITTTQPLSDFATSKLSVVIRPTSDPQYLPDDVKSQQDILDAVKEGKVYSVLSAWPGRSDVPPSSQWNGEWAVVIPKEK